MSGSTGNVFREVISVVAAACSTVSYFCIDPNSNERVIATVSILFCNIVIFFSCLKELYKNRAALSWFGFCTLGQALGAFFGAVIGITSLADDFVYYQDFMTFGSSLMIFCLAVVSSCLRRRSSNGVQIQSWISNNYIHDEEMQIMSNDPPTYEQLFGQQPPRYDEVYGQPSLHGTIYAETEL